MALLIQAEVEVEVEVRQVHQMLVVLVALE
jgi:hypothetical protein